MKSTSSLRLLVDLGQSHLDDAGQQLHKLTSQKQAASEQLDMLQSYRQDYAQRLLDAGQAGLTMSNYHNFVRFMATLDEAIQQQNNILLKLDEKLADSREHWNQKRLRLKAYETLIERRHQTQQTQQQRKDQVQSDEISARMFLKAQSAY